MAISTATPDPSGNADRERDERELQAAIDALLNEGGPARDED